MTDTELTEDKHFESYKLLNTFNDKSKGNKGIKVLTHMMHDLNI